MEDGDPDTPGGTKGSINNFHSFIHYGGRHASNIKLKNVSSKSKIKVF
jgi:hypothetical protein